MLEILVRGLIFVGSLAGMEAVAWVTHRYLMHGPLWFLHESHHRPRGGRLEWNDLFGVMFAIPSVILIYLGTHGHPRLLWAGLGMAAYGLVYFGFHDVMVHRRIGLRIRPTGSYLRRIAQAHRIHHRTLEREGAVSFGFLYAPPLEKLRRRG